MARAKNRPKKPLTQLERFRELLDTPEARMAHWAAQAKALAGEGRYEEARKALAKAESWKKRAGL